MDRKTVSGIVLMLLLVGMTSLAFSVQQVGSSEPPPTEWRRTYGTASEDYASSVVQTNDGGYAIAGNGFANLVKTDSAGNMQWNKSYGGSAASVVQTSDGGYAIAGHTRSLTTYPDFWLVKTDGSGNHQWNKTYNGGGYGDVARSVVQTMDGGYAITGLSYGAFGGKRDFWLVKTDGSGNHQWNQTYGGTNDDWSPVGVQTSDGGYALVGYTDSFGAGSYDFWLVKTDGSGNHQWNKTYGGASRDYASSVVQTNDGGYAIAGWTNSFGAGGADSWLVKTDSVGNMQWNKTYGGASDDLGGYVVETNDGGYAIAGSSGSAGIWSDAWLVKTDGSGNHQWNKTYGGASRDYASSVVQTNDGGYAIAGYTESFGALKDFWLAKVAPTEYTPAVDVSISSPENKTYSADSIPLTFTVNELTSWIGYSLDGQMNMTITGNTTLHGLPDGTHSITVYANDTTGIVGASEMVYFTIETQQEEPFPTWIIAVIVIIAVFGVALLVYFTKVKKTT